MNMTEDQRQECHVIIHGTATAGAGAAAAMAQIPGADNVALVGLEVGMVIALGRVFGVSVTESGAKSLVAAYAGTLVGRGVSQVLIGWIPGLGNAVNAGTAAAVIESLGWAVVADFSNEENRDRIF